MKKCKNLLTIFVICTVFTVQKCYSAVVINSKPGEIDNENDTPLSTLCTISGETDAYCIPIRNCITLLIRLNATEVRARRCGSHKKNSQNPLVCCEKEYVQLESKLTSVQELLTIIPPQQPETVTSSPRPLSSMAPSQPRPSVPLKPLEKPSQKTVVVSEKNPFHGCGFQEISSRILGGEPSSLKEFPWFARLFRRDDRGEIIFSCTGALITPRVVLTTAHCLISDSLQKIGDLYAVALGEHKTECHSQVDECMLNKKTVMISKSIAHPQYNHSSRNHDYDIGLLILRKDVPYSTYISPICLMENEIETTEYYIAGWGKTESDLVSGVKLKAELPSFSWEQCAKKYRSIKIEITPRQICAGGVEGMDSCQGDSGGPLMVYHDMKWYVAGAVSFGLGCGRKGWPAVYAYVPSYLEWIKENVRQNTL